MKNRKNLFRLLVFAAVLVIVSGCAKQHREEGSYKVYYVNTEGTRLMEQKYKPGAQSCEEMMQELLGQLAEAPSG